MWALYKHPLGTDRHGAPATSLGSLFSVWPSHGTEMRPHAQSEPPLVQLGAVPSSQEQSQMPASALPLLRALQGAARSPWASSSAGWAAQGSSASPHRLSSSLSLSWGALSVLQRVNSSVNVFCNSQFLIAQEHMQWNKRQIWGSVEYGSNLFSETVQKNLICLLWILHRMK